MEGSEKMETKNEKTDENEEDASEASDKQMYSALSFSVMLVVVGIPLWWKTTEVYRVSLPYSEIDQLSDYDFKIQMNIHLVALDSVRGEKLTEELNEIFQISKLYNVIIKSHSMKKEVLGSSKTLEEIEQKINHPRFEGSIQLVEIPGLSRFTPKNVILGQSRTIYFSTETDAIKLYHFLQTKILNEEVLLDTIKRISTPAAKALDKNARRRIPPSLDYDVLFTFLNPEPEFLNIQMNISEALEEYISPFLDELADMNGFHVKSQWLYFVNLQVFPKLVDAPDYGQHYALSENLLAHVITPLEKKLGSHVSKHPCLNFVLWFPPCSLSPLHVYRGKGFKGLKIEGADAFISPRWGGIQIYNPDRKDCESSNEKVFVTPDKKYIMSIFLQQLRLLLGIPDIHEIDDGEIIKGPTHLRQWEKDILLRIRTIEQLTSAKHTLQSLSELLGKIGNIVINDEVGQSIISSLKNIHESRTALLKGKLLDAFHHSKSAFLSSEIAFTDPSLLSLLYFPDDQKYAVYIPLFLPVMIPVLISFKQLKKWIVKKIKEMSTFKPKID